MNQIVVRKKSNLANFSGYYYQNRKGKRVRVRKKAQNKFLKGAELLGVAGGLVAGAKSGEAITNAFKVNGVVRKSAVAGGGLLGGSIALMLADRYLSKYD